MLKELKHAKQVEEKLFQKLKKMPRKNRYIYVRGEGGYFFIVFFYSRQSTVSRTCKFEKLIEVVEGAIWDYCGWGRRSFDSLVFDAINFEEAIKIEPTFNKNTAAIFGSKFFEEIEKNRGGC
jgi:UDP-2,3-diacylglucosamine pyrophosphatase LpxH